MITRFIEAVSTHEGAYGNHGKFMLALFDEEEWARRSQVEPPVDDWRSDLIGRTQLAQRGWSQDHMLVFDLQTGEGALFRVGGHPRADLDKHAIWVCPLFEPFLTWLYDRWTDDVRTVGADRLSSFMKRLPDVVTFDQPVEFAGYRRPGHGRTEGTPDGS